MDILCQSTITHHRIGELDVLHYFVDAHAEVRQRSLEVEEGLSLFDGGLESVRIQQQRISFPDIQLLADLLRLEIRLERSRWRLVSIPASC